MPHTFINGKIVKIENKKSKKLDLSFLSLKEKEAYQKAMTLGMQLHINSIFGGVNKSV